MPHLRPSGKCCDRHGSLPQLAPGAIGSHEVWPEGHEVLRSVAQVSIVCSTEARRRRGRHVRRGGVAALRPKRALPDRFTALRAHVDHKRLQPRPVLVARLAIHIVTVKEDVLRKWPCVSR